MKHGPTLIAALMICGSAVEPAAAEPGPAAPAPLTDLELSRERGGLMTPIGLELGFAASMRTYVNGALVLETRLTWTKEGPVTEVLGDVTATGIGPPGATSLTLPALDGATRVVHDLSGGRIASLILNTASNRNIRQDADVTVFLPQLPRLESEFGRQQTGLRLGAALGAALQNSVRAGH